MFLLQVFEVVIYMYYFFFWTLKKGKLHPEHVIDDTFTCRYDYVLEYHT